MKYNIKAKETKYNGRIYRSRLEARWAAYFDIVGWDYEYEPCQVNGFNPDFFIKCFSDSYDCSFVIVEVKPQIMITDEYIDEVYKKYENKKAHILILSDFPFRKSSENGHLISIGIGSQYHKDDRTEMIDFEMKWHDDFGSMYMQFDGMVYGKIERKWFLEIGREINEIDVIENNWKQAGNIVMFKYEKTKNI